VKLEGDAAAMLHTGTCLLLVLTPSTSGLRILSRAFAPAKASDVLSSLAADAAVIEAGGAGVIDAYGESSGWLKSFEAQIAEALGKERAVFVPTGVAAQNMALAVHAELPFTSSRTQPTPSVLLHRSSHLEMHEERAYATLLGLFPIFAGEVNQLLTVTDIERQLLRLGAVGSAPACILVEVPMRELGCATPSWAELLALRALATKYGVPLHLDGARIWEIAPYYAESAGASLPEIIALFDTAYVSFYKGIGAVTGAMLVGSDAFIERTRPWRRRLGANPYTVFPYALSCARGYLMHASSFASRWRKLRDLAPQLRAAAASEGGKLVFVPEVPRCCQCHVFLGAGDSLDVLDAARDAVDAQHGVRVYERLRRADDPLCLTRPSGDAYNAAPDWWFEWTLGPAHVELADDVFVDAWRAFFHVLLGGTDSSSLALGMGPARRFVPPSTGSIPLGPSIVPPSASSVTQDGKSRAE
jgi:threonine aldolase